MAVPSLRHELLVDLFRRRGELAPALLAAVTGIEIPHARVEQASIDLSQVTPITYSADDVVILRAADNTAIHALIVEVQLAIDAAKRRSWPSYVTNLGASCGCPVILIVLAPAGRVARWARKTIETGHPGFRLAPIVIAFEDVPRIIDLVSALKLPELAVLSTLAHPETEIAAVTLRAIKQLPEERYQLYYDALMSALPPAIKQALEAHMKSNQSEFARNYVYQTDFARDHVAQGERLGLTQGLRVAIRTIVRAKLRVVTAQDEAAIRAVRDARTALPLIQALSKATSATQVRGLLAAARSAV